LEITDATADMVFDGLDKVINPEACCLAQIIDKYQSQYTTLMVIRRNVLWGYLRWTNMVCLETRLDEALKGALPVQWSPCPSATTVCQLWDSTDEQHRFLAIDTLRRWMGLKSLSVASRKEHKETINYLITTINNLIRRQVLPPVRLATLLPWMFAFDDSLHITDAAVKRLEQAMDINNVTSTNAPKIPFNLYGFYPEELKETKKSTTTTPAVPIYRKFIEILLLMLTHDTFEEVERFVSAFQYKRHNGDLHSRLMDIKSVTTSLPEEVNNPYNRHNLETQARRVKAASDLIPLCTCNTTANSAWQVFAVLEQVRQGATSITSPLPKLFSSSLYSKHQCLRMFDTPIAWTSNDEGSQDVYANTFFPVFAVNDLENPHLDLCDRFRFMQVAFQGKVDEKTIKTVNETLEQEYKSGYLLPMEEDMNFQEPLLAAAAADPQQQTTTKKRKQPEELSQEPPKKQQKKQNITTVNINVFGYGSMVDP
jgi:hypothetical protein